MKKFLTMMMAAMAFVVGRSGHRVWYEFMW